MSTTVAATIVDSSPSTTTQPPAAADEKLQQQADSNNTNDAPQNDSSNSDSNAKNKKKNRRPRIEFSTLPDTIEGLRDMIKSLKQEQGQKPEFKQKEQQMNSLEKQIVKEKEQITKLRERLSKKPSGDVGTIEDKRKQVQGEIDDISQKIDALKNQDQKHRDRVNNAKDLVRSLIDSKKTFISQHFVPGCFTDVDVAKKLHALKHELSTKTHSTKKEKQLVSDIAKLELSQRHISQLAEYDRSIQLAKQKLDQTKAASKNREQLNALYDERKAKIESRNELFQKIKEKRSKKQTDYDSLNEKRDKVKELIEKKNKIRSEFKQQGDEYYDNQRKIKACELKIEKLKRHAEWEKRQEERKKRQEEREARKAKMEELARLQAEEEEQQRKAEEDAKKAEKRAEEEARLRDPHGRDIVTLKPLLVYLKQIKKPRGRQKKKLIQHPLDKLTLFSQFGVPIPKTAPEVAPVLETLEKKLEEWEADIIAPEVPIEEVRRIRGVPEPVEEDTSEEKNEEPAKEEEQE